MKRYRLVLAAFILAGLLFLLASPPTVRAQTPAPVVRAVLFYSTTCPHCYKVITEDLPPLFDKYGSQLEIIGVDVSQPGGQVLYQAAIEHFGIPQEQQRIPMLIVADVVLVGSLDIPARFPVSIEQHLARGGVDWPDITGLAEALAVSQAAETPAVIPTAPTLQPTSLEAASTYALPTEEPIPTATPGLLLPDPQSSGLGATLARDPLGNALAIVVLAGMIISVGSAILFFRRKPGAPLTRPWAIPVLCAIGFTVAGYLAYVETAQVEAVCGPVGDCNIVQQSKYARLFGVLPIGLLGLFGCSAVFLAWLASRYGCGRLADLASVALLGMTVFGTLFSIYLTFLEPFVIGATCAWCLISAIIMTALFWLSLAPGKLALFHLLHGEPHDYKRKSTKRTIQS